MTRRIQRTQDFDLTLDIRNDEFLRTPRAAQRQWVLNRAMREAADELRHLDGLARRFVPGCEGSGLPDRTQAELRDEDIMEDWQIPVMQAMAHAVCRRGRDVLEIGFGRGIASTFIQEAGAGSHTIVECNDSVVRRFEAWKQGYAGRRVKLLHGRWQDLVSEFDQYDGILFHTYPLNEQEFIEQVVQSDTFAEHFFPTAAAHLREGGVFSYLTNEVDSLSRGHQRKLFQYFRSFSLSLLRELAVPDDTRDALWADSMVMIQVVK